VSVAETTTLGELADILSGFAFKSEYFNAEGGLPIIRIRDVVPGVSGTRYSGPYDRAYLVTDGDMLIGMDGEFNLARWRGGQALLNQRVCRIKGKSMLLDDGYLFHYLPKSLKAIEDATPFVTVKHLSVKQIREIQIPTPPLAEQRRIAAILDKAEALQLKRSSSTASLMTLVKSVFGGMFGDLGQNERSWPEFRLGSLCELVRGSSPRPKSDPRYYGGPVPRLMVADVTRDGWKVTPRIDSLTLEGAKKSRPVKAGTVVMAVSGEVGVVSQLTVDACIHDGFVAFIGLKSSVIRPEFLVILLDLLKYTHEKRKAGAIFQNLTTTDIKEMVIPVPPVSNQDEFLNRSHSIERIRSSAGSSSERIDALFVSLQNRAFRGEL
jgi:restriction endonuclease S subunit